MLKIYNTLTRKKEEFIPLNPPHVTVYSCGPTVYDYFHIGNARSFVMSDIVRRYLIYSGYKVKFAMNLTDIDDKIINKANALGIDSTEVAKKFSDAFFEDIDKLGLLRADVNPRATEHIPEIIAMIEALIKNGKAYEVNGDVFYEISQFPGYGKLSGKNIDDLESGSRVEVNEIKRSPLDFALWKSAKPGEPWWESPWGKGRPGWHIECSAMSCKHLGETFDIHAGGSDLIFPHHENEIAQSEGATGKPFARFWMHYGFLNIDNEKMSKSLGNVFNLRDMVKKYKPETLRFFYAQTHYASPLNFTAEALESADRGLEKLNNLFENLKQGLASGPASSATQYDFSKSYEAFKDAMDDDFNSPKAIAVVYDFIKEVNTIIASGQGLTREFYEGALEFLKKTAEGVLGILRTEKVEAADAGLEHELIELLIRLRIDAKKEKNYPLSDKIRNELNALGITLQDTKEGSTYKKNR
ncbi:MAG: cysteine--tRNA ligase [Ignavibacteria bacterium]|nr:cysteine--tRNA ligase [Ignavibacteria bacterium]